jgi:putative addiction module component (TIGR02574 family)
MDRSFEQMTTAERVLYVQALWERIAEEPDGVPLSEAQRVEVRRRVEEHRANPGSIIAVFHTSRDPAVWRDRVR